MVKKTLYRDNDSTFLKKKLYTLGFKFAAICRIHITGTILCLRYIMFLVVSFKPFMSSKRYWKHKNIKYTRAKTKICLNQINKATYLLLFGFVIPILNTLSVIARIKKKSNQISYNMASICLYSLHEMR